MPELPEVETIRRQLEPLLRERTITQAWSFGTTRFEQAVDTIGHRITGLGRRGKYLILGLEPTVVRTEQDGTDLTRPAREMVLHLGMTGKLSVDDPVISVGGFRTRVRSPHLRAEWLLDDDRVLEFTDIRRFGRIAVVGAGHYESLPTLDQMGPEPFDTDFTPVGLRDALATSEQTIKAQLMSQKVVAGLGNIYVDEALWLARVHPASKRVTRDEAVRLHDSIRVALRSGLDNGGTTLRDYRDVSGNSGTNQLRLQCYGRAGRPCGRCGRDLQRAQIAGRTTTYCPRCQRRRL